MPGRRLPAERRCNRLAAVAAASIALAVPAWLFVSSDPQSADAPPAPDPASPAPTTTSVTANPPPTTVADTPPPPSPDDHVAKEQIGGRSKAGRADDRVGGEGGPGGGRSHGKGNGRGNSG
jgi:hypothetical protein